MGQTLVVVDLAFWVAPRRLYGEERFSHGWLRHNERDMASLAWEMAAVRERKGLGPIKALHQ